MLTITTEKQVVYINIDLLKNKVKRTVTLLLKISTIICVFCGVLLIMGSVGSSDNNIIPFSQILQYIKQGGIFCGVGYVLNIIKNALQ